MKGLKEGDYVEIEEAPRCHSCFSGIGTVERVHHDGKITIRLLMRKEKEKEKCNGCSFTFCSFTYEKDYTRLQGCNILTCVSRLRKLNEEEVAIFLL